MGKTTTLHKKWRSTEAGSSVTVYPLMAKRKKLHLIGVQKNKRTTKELILDSVIHELQNCLQSISMGMDLLQLSQAEQVESHAINNGIERASRLLRETQEYFFRPESSFSTKNLREAIEEAVQKATKESKKANLRFQCARPLPSMHHDWLTFSRVLDRILRCSRGLVSSEGGEIVASVNINEALSPVAIEITVEINGTSELPVEEEKIFTPCCRVNEYQTGLALVLAREAIRSQKGELTFAKINACQARFTIRLAIPSNNYLVQQD